MLDILHMVLGAVKCIPHYFYFCRAVYAKQMIIYEEKNFTRYFKNSMALYRRSRVE